MIGFYTWKLLRFQTPEALLDSDKMSIACGSLPTFFSPPHSGPFILLLSRKAPLWPPVVPARTRDSPPKCPPHVVLRLTRVKAGPKSITLRLSSRTCFHHWHEDCSSRLPLTIDCGVSPDPSQQSHPIILSRKKMMTMSAAYFTLIMTPRTRLSLWRRVVPPSHPQSLLFPPKSFP